MPEQIKNDNPAFGDGSELYGKKPNIEPAPDRQIGIDTEGKFYEDIINAAFSNKLDMSSLDSFLTTSRSRDQIYTLLDTMCEDSTIAAIMETYAEDATQANENGDIIWVESDDPDVAGYVSYLLNAMRVNKHAYGWMHSLCKYGDIYLRMYRESDYEQDSLFDTPDNGAVSKGRTLNEDVHLSDPDIDPTTEEMNKEPLNEEVKIKAYSKDDHYVHYLEMIPNPAEMFELTKFGKSYAYIKTEINTPLTSNKDWYQGSEFLRYSFKKNDVNVFQPTEFVHGYLEDNTSRTPEEVKIFFTDSTSEDAPNATYKVRRGQSLLYDAFKIWRELTLLENSILLNRVTKSSLVRVVGVEVGDMPKENVGPHLQGVKSLIEQKSALDVGGSMNEYTNPGPVENNVYIPTRQGQGALTLQQIGGDVNVGQLTDLDYFRDKLFGCLKIPKQFFGFTEDGAGFNGGQSLSIISSRYAKTINRLQSTMCQTITDAINLILLDKDLPHYVDNFSIKMLPPVTQDDLDRRENLSNKVQLTRDTMDMLADIQDPATKLKILKNLLSSYITDPDILSLIQGEIESLEKEQEAKPVQKTSSEEGDLDTELSSIGTSEDTSFDLDSALGMTGEEPSEEGEEEEPAGEAGGEALPTPASLGMDFTDSSAPEFQ